MTTHGINRLKERKLKALEYALRYNNLYSVLYCNTTKRIKKEKARKSLRDYWFWSKALCEAEKLFKNPA